MRGPIKAAPFAARARGRGFRRPFSRRALPPGEDFKSFRADGITLNCLDPNSRFKIQVYFGP